jgi:seryl-tRNA synthetase
MHDIRWIRDNAAAFDAALKRRGLEPMSASLLAIDERRRGAITASEQAQARRNAASKEIGDAKKAKDDARAAKLMAEVAELKTSMPELELAAKSADEELAKILAAIPNLPLDDVPDGVDEHGNVQRHIFGAPRNYAFTPKPHDDLGGALGFMDFETAAKLSGARFVVLKKGLARLERAIGQFMLDLHTNEHGYTEVNPPLLVRDDVMFGTGQLPKFADDQFSTVNKVEAADASKKLVKRSIDETFERLPHIIAEIEKETGKKVTIEHALRRMSDVVNADMQNYLEELDKALSEKFRLWLIPTAEVPLTNLVRETIVDEKELPMRLTALTPCFRAEAGAAGRDTRGMIRQHQFTKVELVSTSRSGCRGKEMVALSGKSQAARCAASSRPAVWMRAIAEATASRVLCIP